MEYWKTTVTILLPLLANIFSYWGLLRSGGLNTRKYWLVEVRRPQYEKILASRGDWEWLYCDSSRGIRWNIAWALGKSLGLRPRDFPRAQAIFHRIPLLSSQYSYILNYLTMEYWKIAVAIFPSRQSVFPRELQSLPHRENIGRYQETITRKHWTSPWEEAPIQ